MAIYEFIQNLFSSKKKTTERTKPRKVADCVYEYYADNDEKVIRIKVKNKRRKIEKKNGSIIDKKLDGRQEKLDGQFDELDEKQNKLENGQKYDKLNGQQIKKDEKTKRKNKKYEWKEIRVLKMNKNIENCMNSTDKVVEISGDSEKKDMVKNGSKLDMNDAVIKKVHDDNLKKIIDYADLHRQKKVLSWNIFAERAEYARRVMGSYLEYKRFITIEHEKIFGEDSRIFQDVRKKKIWDMNRNIRNKQIEHKHRKDSIIITEEECIKCLEYKVYESVKDEMSTKLSMALQRLKHHLYCDREMIFKRLNKPKADLIMDIRNVLIGFAEEFGCAFHGEGDNNLAGKIEDFYYSDDEEVDYNLMRRRMKASNENKKNEDNYPEYIRDEDGKKSRIDYDMLIKRFKYVEQRPKIKVEHLQCSSQREWSEKIREESKTDKKLRQRLLINDYERVTGFKYIERKYPDQKVVFKPVAQCIKGCPFINPLEFMIKTYGWPEDVRYVSWHDFQIEHGFIKLDCGCSVDRNDEGRFVFSNKRRDEYKALWLENEALKKELSELKNRLDQAGIKKEEVKEKERDVYFVFKDRDGKVRAEKQFLQEVNGTKIVRQNLFERLDEQPKEKPRIKSYEEKLKEAYDRRTFMRLADSIKPVMPTNEHDSAYDKSDYVPPIFKTKPLSPSDMVLLYEGGEVKKVIRGEYEKDKNCRRFKINGEPYDDYKKEDESKINLQNQPVNKTENKDSKVKPEIRSDDNSQKAANIGLDKNGQLQDLKTKSEEQPVSLFGFKQQEQTVIKPQEQFTSKQQEQVKPLFGFKQQEQTVTKSQEQPAPLPGFKQQEQTVTKPQEQSTPFFGFKQQEQAVTKPREQSTPFFGFKQQEQPVNKPFVQGQTENKGFSTLQDIQLPNKIGFGSNSMEQKQQEQKKEEKAFNYSPLPFNTDNLTDNKSLNFGFTTIRSNVVNRGDIMKDKGVKLQEVEKQQDVTGSKGVLFNVQQDVGNHGVKSQTEGNGFVFKPLEQATTKPQEQSTPFFGFKQQEQAVTKPQEQSTPFFGFKPLEQATAKPQEQSTPFFGFKQQEQAVTKPQEQSTPFFGFKQQEQHNITNQSQTENKGSSFGLAHIQENASFKPLRQNSPNNQFSFNQSNGQPSVFGQPQTSHPVNPLFSSTVNYQQDNKAGEEKAFNITKGLFNNEKETTSIGTKRRFNYFDSGTKQTDVPFYVDNNKKSVQDRTATHFYSTDGPTIFNNGMKDNNNVNNNTFGNFNMGSKSLFSIGKTQDNQKEEEKKDGGSGLNKLDSVLKNNSWIDFSKR